MIRGLQGKELPEHCKFNFVASLSIYRPQMDQKAQSWFDERLTFLASSDEGTKEAPMLPFNKKYDDQGIDFEKVKKEYEQLRKTLGW